ncbi:hypothetical protein [Streptomyces collinus]|uniref:hypothetical protein n=1 Tax=Streptomyces collinus TaxID=42684 RepID=UPI0037B23305
MAESIDKAPKEVVCEAIVIHGEGGSEQRLACPTCGVTQHLTVFGFVGGEAGLMCPKGHRFDPPAPLTAGALLAQAVGSMPDDGWTNYPTA